MASKLRLSPLIPAGLVVESIAESEGTIVVTARGGGREKACSLCGRSSSRGHSRYVRRVSDLPYAGRKVELRLVARRFFCEEPFCQRRIFAERFEDGTVAERSRRTSRLECIVHHLGLALGGRPAASFAKRLMVPVSNDTLLLVVRRRACSPTDPLSAIGIDDWAFRRNHRHGTIVCDLERRRIMTLLPDREIATIEAWLADHPEIAIVARDRGGTLLEARGLIDRFHSTIRKKIAADLEPWIAEASASLIASFANGIARDKAAVCAAISEPWSNGQTEGQITKLKLVKRQMYGRSKIDLLQARLIDAM